MRIERRRVGSKLRRRWLLANVIGFTAGGAVALTVVRAMSQPYFGVVTSGAEAARIEAMATGASMTIFGAFVGTAQWAALRRKFQAGWWIPATCLGWALMGVGGGALSGPTGGAVSNIGPKEVGIPVAFVAAVAGILIGLLPGTFQWLVLRQQVGRAGWWPLANLGGLILGFGAGLAVVRWGLVDVIRWLQPEDFPSGKVGVLVGAVAGTMYGAATWPLLARLLRRAALVDAGRGRTAEARHHGPAGARTDPWTDELGGVKN